MLEHQQTEQQQPAQTVDPAAVAPPHSVTTFTAMGQVPGVSVQSSPTVPPSASTQAFGPGGPEIEATDQALGQHMVEGMNRANASNSLDHGIHYSYNFESTCRQLNRNGLWKDQYRMGHTWATQFHQPHERGQFMDWELKRGKSASQAIKDWLRGATIAECLTTVVAMEIDSLRAAIGDRRFDKLYGSADSREDSKIRATSRMRISTEINTTPVGSLLRPTDAARAAYAQGGEAGTVDEATLEADLVPGQWYYFTNHPKYLLKHPGGAWQGENALYMGKNAAGEREWSGLGATKTEDAMIEEMALAFNGARDAHDERAMREYGIKNADGTYVDRNYDPASGVFPDEVTAGEVLKAQPFSLGGRTRRGGFSYTSGHELDASAVRTLRNGR